MTAPDHISNPSINPLHHRGHPHMGNGAFHAASTGHRRGCNVRRGNQDESSATCSGIRLYGCSGYPWRALFFCEGSQRDRAARRDGMAVGGACGVGASQKTLAR